MFSLGRVNILTRLQKATSLVRCQCFRISGRLRPVTLLHREANIGVWTLAFGYSSSNGMLATCLGFDDVAQKRHGNLLLYFGRERRRTTYKLRNKIFSTLKMLGVMREMYRWRS
jgi:hypothetical protein